MSRSKLSTKSKSAIKKPRSPRKSKDLKKDSIPAYPPKYEGPKVYSNRRTHFFVLVKKTNKTEEVFTYSEDEAGLKTLCDKYNAESVNSKYYIVKQAY